MDKIDIQAALTRNAQKATQSNSSPSPERMKLTAMLWDGLSRIYRNRWTAQEGPAMEGERPSKNFVWWLRKTEHLSTEEIVRGLKRCEQLVQDGATGDGTTWPPTYAEFIGYCQPPKKDEVKAEHKILPRGLPEPKESREKRRAIGRERCGAILDFLSE